MNWLINLFLGRIFVYLRKLARKTNTLLDDKTVDILVKSIKTSIKHYLQENGIRVLFDKKEFIY